MKTKTASERLDSRIKMEIVKLLLCGAVVVVIDVLAIISFLSFSFDGLNMYFVRNFSLLLTVIVINKIFMIHCSGVPMRLLDATSDPDELSLLNKYWLRTLNEQLPGRITPNLIEARDKLIQKLDFLTKKTEQTESAY